jgi:hypothetical protein
MNIYSTLRSSLRNVALVALDEFVNPLVIYSHANGTEPSGSYVTVSILNVEQQGQHTSSGLVEESLIEYEQTITTANEVMCQFSFVGSQSGEMAYSFYQRINNNPLVFEELARNKLGFMRKSQVRRAPQKRDTTWVEYHNLDVTFSYHVVTKQVVDIVEGITVEGVYNDTIQDNFTIPEDLVITP